MLIFGVVAAGCGDVGHEHDGGAPANAVREVSAAAAARADGSILSDGDADNPSDLDGDADNPENVYEPGEYTDKDGGELDTRTPASYLYPDRDDLPLLSWGQRADGVERTSIYRVAYRYFASAQIGDGQAACRLIVPNLERTVAATYGQAPGPSYMRGSRDCATAVSLLFSHFHSRLVRPVRITEVRTERDVARVFLGSSVMHASSITLERRHGRWGVAEIFCSPLP